MANLNVGSVLIGDNGKKRIIINNYRFKTLLDTMQRFYEENLKDLSQEEAGKFNKKLSMLMYDPMKNSPQFVINDIMLDPEYPFKDRNATTEREKRD
jgi:hypothetical protein